MMFATSPVSRPTDGLVLPEGASLLTRLRVALKALQVLEKDPGDSVAAPLLNASLDGAIYARLANTLHETAEGRDLLTKRPTLQASAIDLNELQRLPPGTLGHELACYFQSNKIQPFESPYVVRNDVDFLSKRYRETHDIAHVITGYGTDVVGEMELQAFMVGNLGIRTGILILTYSVVKWMHGLSPLAYYRRLKKAYQLGRQSRLLIDVIYEDLWETPVTMIRQRVGIVPGVELLHR